MHLSRVVFRGPQATNILPDKSPRTGNYSLRRCTSMPVESPEGSWRVNTRLSGTTAASTTAHVR
jgi:hypothetical protein